MAARIVKPHPSIVKLHPPWRFREINEPHARRIIQKLPNEYQKFWMEWKDREDEATPVHWIPRTEKWEILRSGEIKPVQNEPIPVKYPHQMHYGLWGGEGVVDGLVKKAKYRVPVTRFWVPNLFRGVVYSEILNKYFRVVMTNRANDLIDQHYGLDFYLLKNPAYELKSMLALKLKRLMFEALWDKSMYPHDEKKRDEVYEKYKDLLIPREEVEWYGLTVEEAITKLKRIEAAASVKYPLKNTFRQQLIKNLEAGEESPHVVKLESATQPLLQRLNPFSKSS